MKRQFVKKSLALFLAAAIALPVLAISAFALSDETAAEGNAALTVFYGDDTFTLTDADLIGIADAEGGNAYTYTSFNTYPTPKTVTGTYGPSIIGILEDVGIDVSGIENNTITFTATDSYTVSLTIGSLLAERYCFPNGAESIKGGFEADSVYLTGKTAVPAIINLNSNDQLLFGQLAPNDITNNSFNKNMIGGSITISSSAAGQYAAPAIFSDAACTVVIADKSDVAAGDKLYFSKESASEARVYYTVSTDGTEPADPTVCSYMYDTSDKSDERKSPYEVNSDKKLIVKAVIIGRGKTDSEVVTYYLNGASKFTAFFAGIYAWIKALFQRIFDYFQSVVNMVV